jgi:hypothetical protein
MKNPRWERGKVFKKNTLPLWQRMLAPVRLSQALGGLKKALQALGDVYRALEGLLQALQAVLWGGQGLLQG